MVLTKLERDYLTVCAGGIASLPYQDRDAMARANRRLTDLGFIESGYDDDQPTSRATDAGLAALTVAYTATNVIDDIAEAVMPFIDENCSRRDIEAAIAETLASRA